MNARKSTQPRKEVRFVRLSIEVDEATWKALREIAEEDRTPRGRASVNALVNKLIAEHLSKRKAKGGK